MWCTWGAALALLTAGCPDPRGGDRRDDDDDDSADDVTLDDDDDSADDDDAVDPGILVVGPDPDRPHVLDFGEVDAGDTRDLDLTISNLGPDALTIQDLVLSNFASFEMTRDALGSLEPGRSVTVRVTYSPVQIGRAHV
jgi:hypothetical protein